MRAIHALLWISLVTACARQAVPVRPAATRGDSIAPAVMMRVASVSEPFYPQGTDSAIAAFRPAVQPADSAGSCRSMRTGGSGATTIMAEFHARDSTITMVSFAFDSAGNLVRFNDTRGTRRYRPPPGATPAQLDSTRRASESRGPVTTIGLDFAMDQALAANRVGGETDAVIGTVRRFENLESLGPPNDRIKRIRKFCGV